ncbi:protein phosphatase 1 regulatory subunit 1A isoform X1 [Struthio camelus]|uniref:protein phosphatase 1 regulatory subunit 1A isoform X1 n=1 Tax=Struthio camelus TaxID=8801 RepID=UPI003603B4CB
MEPNSPRKIQFTVPLLEPHLDPEAAEQIRRRRPTPANLVLSSDQSSPEIDEDRLPNPLLKSGLAMSPRQRKKVSRTTPTMKELQMMVEHHLCKQAQGEEEDEAAAGSQDQHSPGCCHHGDTEHSHSPGGTCPLAHAQPTREGGPAPGTKGEAAGTHADTRGDGRQSLAGEGTHISPKEAVGKGAATSQ